MLDRRLLLVWLGSECGQDDREDDQSVVETEEDGECEDLEECEEDVSCGEGAERQGQEGGQTAVKNSRTNTEQS